MNNISIALASNTAPFSVDNNMYMSTLGIKKLLTATFPNVGRVDTQDTFVTIKVGREEFTTTYQELIADKVSKHLLKFAEPLMVARCYRKAYDFFYSE